jgi:hypothetical protein
MREGGAPPPGVGAPRARSANLNVSCSGPQVCHTRPLPKPNPVRPDRGAAWRIFWSVPHPPAGDGTVILSAHPHPVAPVAGLSCGRHARPPAQEGGHTFRLRPHGPRRGPLARRDPFTLRLLAEGVTVRVIPSALCSVRGRSKHWSWHHDVLADQGSPYGPPVHRRRPYPGY